MSNFLIEEEIKQIDSLTGKILEFEEARQRNKIILIASESIAPKAVRETLGSVFTNIYAEGHPSLKMIRDKEELLADISHQNAYYRRYSDRRYYKGNDYVNLVEALAMRRAAECFSTKEIASEEIYVNVQPLSGAAANNAVYHAFAKLGDTVMGMALTHGGHLSHGSPYHRSGKQYRIISYEVDPVSGKLNYERIRKLAIQHKPRMIIAGYSSYPWLADWKKFREIADSVPGGAILFADIAHTAGLVAAGVAMNPVGYADVTVFTTHKTLCGPRGAVILTTDEKKAALIDQAVFPGEQGGPHINKIAAMAVSFKVAQSARFKKLQKRIIDNARVLAGALKASGLKIAYGGTDSHLLVVDLKAIKTKTGTSLSGEIASRILDLVGIVVNKNILPGDKNANEASAIRLGTTWVSQLGMGKKEMEKLARIIHKVLVNIHPFVYIGAGKTIPRGKIERDIFREARAESEKLISSVIKRKISASPFQKSDILKVRGERAQAFLQSALAGDILPLKKGEVLNTALLNQQRKVIDKISLLFQDYDKKGEFHYILRTSPDKGEEVAEWFKGLSGGYISFDEEDIFAKIEGPVVIEKADTREAKIFKGRRAHTDEGDIRKPYFIGERMLRKKSKSSVKKKRFQFKEEKTAKVKRTPLYDEHLKAGGKMVLFAGWEMPVWYSRISIEHKAIRETAGLFDIGHMGIIEIVGRDATAFLDAVASNYARWLKPGESQYSFILNPKGEILDDVIIYCRGKEHYMMVVNAANAPKVWQWLKGVHSGELLIDSDFPEKEFRGDVKLRNLKDERVDLALQGPASFAILKRLSGDKRLFNRIAHLHKNEFIETKLGGTKMIISRTGYTGEDVGYELYLHPNDAVKIWKLLLKKGEDLGLIPAGLGARDSTRTEAGLPLYGHELAGPQGISPLAAVFGVFVKLHKPYFVGKRQVIVEETKRKKEIVRFRMKDKGIMMVRAGYKIEDNGGKDLGVVTSSVLVEGYQIGMAYIERDCISEGGEIKILIPSREEKYTAVILPRFPIKEESDES